MDVPFSDRALNRMGAMKACSRCHVEIEALELDLHSVTQRPSRHRQQTSKFERYSEDEDDWEVERARIAQRRRREGAQRREGAMGGGRTN